MFSACADNDDTGGHGTWRSLHSEAAGSLCFHRNNPSMRPLIAALLATFAATTALSPVAAQESRRPNIVVILVDDLGAGDLACYGATDMQTPAIDRLTARGMKFTRAYANCPVCSPTRAALLSGRYPELVGVPGVVRTHSPKDSWGYLAPGSVLLPQALKQAGYRTACIGKWHLGDRPECLPNAKGFEHFRGFLGDMMDDYFHHRRAGRNYMRHDREIVDPKGHATDVFTDWAVDYLRARGRDGAERRPFFLYLAYNAPHTPIQPPTDWLAKVRARAPRMSLQRARLVALIEHLDAGVGRVVDALDDAGLTDDTLVVFTSDNGGQLGVGADNGDLRGGKQDMYEGGLRVPQAAVWPGHIAAGARTDQSTLSMDLFATCCAVAGVEPGPDVDGVSILPTLRGEPQTIQRDLFWTRKEGNQRYMGQSVWAVRSNGWKLLQNDPQRPFELYHLAEDPREARDVRTQHPKVYRELSRKLRAHIQRGGAVPWQPPERAGRR